jgi:hypothetical protein
MGKCSSQQSHRQLLLVLPMCALQHMLLMLHMCVLLCRLMLCSWQQLLLLVPVCVLLQLLRGN